MAVRVGGSGRQVGSLALGFCGWTRPLSWNSPTPYGSLRGRTKGPCRRRTPVRPDGRGRGGGRDPGTPTEPRSRGRDLDRGSRPVLGLRVSPRTPSVPGTVPVETDDRRGLTRGLRRPSCPPPGPTPRLPRRADPSGTGPRRPPTGSGPSRVPDVAGHSRGSSSSPAPTRPSTAGRLCPPPTPGVP